MNPIVPFLAAAGVGLFVLSRKSGSAPSSTSAPSNGPQPLWAGVPYLFIVRLDVGVTDEAARAALEPKGVEMLVLAPAVNPPFWVTTLNGVPAGVWSQRVASFKATPKGNSTVTLGNPFYGVGRLETLARLDGRPFAEAAGAA